MELYQLKLFCDLANTGNFTKVAAENYVTQAAVTLQIRKLESELGVPLFHRTTRSVTLLEAGQRLLPFAQDVLGKVESAVAAVRDTKSEVSGLVRVASVHTVGLYELPTHVKTFLKKYPDVNLRIEYRTSEEIYRSLLDNEIDLGIVAFPTETARVEVVPFHTDTIALMCPQNHPLANKKQVSITELEGQNLVQFSEETPTRRATDLVLQEHGVNVNVRMECDNVEILKNMVELEYGVALLPRQVLTTADKAAGLRLVALSDVKIERPLAILLLKNAPRFKAARAFMDVLCAPADGAKKSRAK